MEKAVFFKPVPHVKLFIAIDDQAAKKKVEDVFERGLQILDFVESGDDCDVYITNDVDRARLSGYCRQSAWYILLSDSKVGPEPLPANVFVFTNEEFFRQRIWVTFFIMLSDQLGRRER